MPNIPLTGDLFLLGDVHCTKHQVVHAINAVPDDSTILQVGDFGMGFYESNAFLNAVENAAKKKNVTIMAIRGNHDDPCYFDGERIRPHILLLDDYTRIDWEGTNILVVGGAISIDRKARDLYKNYWPDENIKLQANPGKCDILITHSCPMSSLPIEFMGLEGISHWTDKDDLLEEDIIKERKDHATLLKQTQPKRHYCGHFHISHDDGTTRILDIAELVQL